MADQCMKPCSSDASCPTGVACFNGFCHPSCLNTSMCRPGYTCASLGGGNRQCVPSSQTTCRFEGDCGGGFACGSNAQCKTSCSADSDCYRGAVCQSGKCVGVTCRRSSSTSSSYYCTWKGSRCYSSGCRISCSSDSTCPYGYKCSSSYCKTNCASTADCKAGYMCTGGVCVGKAPTTCTTYRDCNSGYKCTNNTCVLGKKCGSDADCTPTTEKCSNGFCESNTGSTSSYKSCSTSCTGGESCVDIDDQSGPAKACLAKCSTSNPCANDYSCRPYESSSSSSSSGYCFKKCTSVSTCQNINSSFGWVCVRGICLDQ